TSAAGNRDAPGRRPRPGRPRTGNHRPGPRRPHRTPPARKAAMTHTQPTFRPVRERRTLTVPADGGHLAVSHWPGSGPPVGALHSSTANSLAFAALADALPRLDLYAPDLRGRAGSARLPGPYGLAAHVADTLGLLDHL